MGMRKYGVVTVSGGVAILVSLVALTGCPNNRAVENYVCLSCHDGRSASDASAFPSSPHSFLDCEDCHGSGYSHVRNGGRGGDFIRNPENRPFAQLSDLCEDCHGFETDDFRTSVHFAAEAANCSDCHNVHGTDETRVPAADNTLCLMCHDSLGFTNDEAVEAHTFHPVDPDGTGASRCVACHMPPTGRVAQAFGPHVHSMNPIPPIASNEAMDDGVFPAPPNSCSGTNGCHDGTVITAPVFDVDNPEHNELLQILYDERYGTR